MKKLNVSSWSPFEQSLLDIAIKTGVFAVLLVLNFITAGLSGGTIQLPYPAASLPIATLILSQLDSKFIQWAKEENVPLPGAGSTTTPQ